MHSLAIHLLVKPFLMIRVFVWHFGHFIPLFSLFDTAGKIRDLTTYVQKDKIIACLISEE